jgi:hypothetical protein
VPKLNSKKFVRSVELHSDCVIISAATQTLLRPQASVLRRNTAGARALPADRGAKRGRDEMFARKNIIESCGSPIARDRAVLKAGTGNWLILLIPSCCDATTKVNCV